MMTKDEQQHTEPDPVHHRGADPLKENKKIIKTRATVRYYNTMYSKKEDYKTATPDELYNILNEAKNPTIYESIEDGIRPYADYEKDFKTKKEMEANKATIREFIIDEFSRGFGCSPDKIAVLEAHAKKGRLWRLSYHLIAYEAPPMSDGLEVLRLIENDNKTGFDEAPYKAYGRRQLFRTVLSNKENEGRPFIRTDKPLTKENFKECLISFLGEYEINDEVEEMAGALDRLEHIHEEEREEHIKICRAKQEADIEWIKSSVKKAQNGGLFLTKTEIELLQIGETEDLINIKKAFDSLERYRPDIFKNIAGVKNILRNRNDDGSLVIIFKRLKSSYCKIHERNHDADNTDAILKTKNCKCFICV